MHLARFHIKLTPIGPMVLDGNSGISDRPVDFLLLATPPQHAADNPAVERNASRLKLWIAELPIMDVMGTVQQLHASISPLNELVLADAERFKLLEVYRQGLEEVFLIYDEQRLKVLPLSTDQRTALASDIMGLYLELANGYKILVRNGHDDGESPAEDTLLLQAVYRAMEMIGLAVLYAQRVELATPELAWLELHQLYAFSDKHGALQKRVKAARYESEVPTIERVYTQSMLLSVMHTGQLTGVELMDLFLLLETYSSYCHFGHELPDQAQNGCFTFSLMADAPPQACFANPVAEKSAGHELLEFRVLDIAPVRVVVEAWLEKRKSEPADTQDQDVSQMRVLAGLLGSHWGRRGPRTPVQRFVKVALGLKALEYFLSDPEHLTQACSAEVHGGIEVLSLDSEDEMNYQLSDWRMLDQSDTGCLLAGRVSIADETPAVGTLLGVVGFQPEVSEQRLSIGIVRWWGEISEGRTKLGLEVIEGAAQPIFFGRTSEGLDHMPELGFYFPKNDADGRSASLLLPRRNSQEPLHVRVQGKAFEIETVSVVREAEDFVQYNFKLHV